jgi:hypothetical protein
LLAAVTYVWFFGGTGWNQGAQFDLARALVERQTLYIDGYDTNTKDVSVGVGGHRYINKVPGTSLLAVVPYALVYWFLEATPRTAEWICTAATCGLCGALIAPILYLHGRWRYQAVPRDALCITLAIAFGTIVFAYSTMLFAQAPATLFLLAAVVTFERRPFAAGAAAGMATLCFDVCAAAALVLLLLLLLHDRRAAARFVAGGAPFALVLALYLWACFGSPFRPPLEASARFTEQGLLLGFLRLPSVETLYYITFSPFRGLFVASPFLLFALSGIGLVKERRERIVLAGIPALFLLVIASFNGWSGGWAFGPRYLLPIVPILGILMFAAVRAAKRLVRVVWLAAVLFSVATNFVATAVDPAPPLTVHDPIFAYLWPAFLTGQVPEETRKAMPFRSIRQVSNAGESGNLGEALVGEGTRASVAPIALWLAGGSAALLFATRRLREVSAGPNRGGTTHP